jgi:hypothetical protein
MDSNSEIDVFVPQQSTQDESFTPLEYSVGEICKCYYNDVKKSGHGKISQSILKCQSFGKVVERNQSDKREYTVELFDPIDDDKIRRVPGCCLRKVKVIPFGFEDATRNIGRVVRSKDGDERMMIVTVSKDGSSVRVNDIDAEDLLGDFEFVDNGSPCGKIVMLKADEAFGGAQRT